MGELEAQRTEQVASPHLPGTLYPAAPGRVHPTSASLPGGLLTAVHPNQTPKALKASEEAMGAV